jgi:flagellar basal body rod protein FlgC
MSENSNAPSGASVDSSLEVESSENEIIESEGNEEGLEETHGHTSEEDIDNDDSLSKQEKKEAKKALRELEIKYNGKVEKVKLPFDVPEEHADYMRRQLQMAKMGQHKAQDYAALERDIVSFFNELKNDPRKALSNPAYGVDLKKIAVEMIEEEIANSQKTPEELEKEEYKRKLAEYEEKEQQRLAEIEEMRKQKVIEEAYAQYDVAMSDTLERFDIPKSPIAIYEMAHLMSLEIKRGYEPDMDTIGEMVSDKFNGKYSEHLKSLPHEKLVKLLGEEVFERERKNRVSKIKKAPVPVKSAVKDVAEGKKREEPSKPKLTYKERFGI